MKSHFVKLTLTVIPAVMVASLLLAQESFDVVSVKPNVSGNGPSDPRISPGRFSWTNVALRQLIQVAYDKRPYQLIGMPEWINGAHFDVMVTTRNNTSPQQMDTMLQHLLAERFNLTVHHDSRELPVYALVIARRDGRLGPRIQPAAVDCQAINAKPLDAGAAQAEYSGCMPQMGLTRLKFTGFRMAAFASGLMRILDRTVIDKTGLSGAFDIELSWVPDPTMLPNGVPAPTNALPDGASIFTALEEQLGLKLVSDRAPVEVLVIDRLERPKPD